MWIICEIEVAMNTFNDKQGRDIIIEIDDLDVVARYAENEIGRLSFEQVDFDKSPSFIQLMNMNVAQEYQRAGIATEMMRAAVELHGEFVKPVLSAVGGSMVASEDYFTSEGAALISRCISLGILPPDKDEDPDIDDEWDS